MKLRILVINLNNIDYTENCVHDLLRQTHRNFELVILDQASTEAQTKERLLKFQNEPAIKLVFNHSNTPLNSVWNWFHANSSAEYDLLCFLNNDVRLTKNFVVDTIEVFEREPLVGIAAHATNHEQHQHSSEELGYKIVPPHMYLQGWDYTLRSKLYQPIPAALKTYCGDDFLYSQIYDAGYLLAYITSSPIIHYEGASKKDLKEDGMLDTERYLSMGYQKQLRINDQFSRIKPEFDELLEHQ